MAISFDPAAFIVLYPEFASVASARIVAVSDEARNYVSEGVFGDKAVHALSLYTAHLLALSDPERGGSRGAITSEKVGDLSTSYASPQVTTVNMDATTYGARFSKLARQVTGHGMFHVGI